MIDECLRHIGIARSRLYREAWSFQKTDDHIALAFGWELIPDCGWFPWISPEGHRRANCPRFTAFLTDAESIISDDLNYSVTRTIGPGDGWDTYSCKGSSAELGDVAGAPSRHLNGALCQLALAVLEKRIWIMIAQDIGKTLNPAVVERAKKMLQHLEGSPVTPKQPANEPVA